MNNYDRLMECVENAIDDFDFEKVSKVMQFLNWQWATTKGVPTQEDMSEMVRSLSESAYERLNSTGEEMYRASSGGFVVEVSVYDDGESPSYFVDIEFVLTSSQYDEEWMSKGPDDDEEEIDLTAVDPIDRVAELLETMQYNLTLMERRLTAIERKTPPF